MGPILGIISALPRGNIQIQVFLTSALVGAEWSALRPGHFTPRERAPRTNWVGGWVGPRACLDAVEKRKFLILPGLKLDPSLVQLVALPTALTKLCLSIIAYHETPLL
jgi:hypothetical protein